MGENRPTVVSRAHKSAFIQPNNEKKQYINI